MAPQTVKKPTSFPIAVALTGIVLSLSIVYLISKMVALSRRVNILEKKIENLKPDEDFIQFIVQEQLMASLEAALAKFEEPSLSPKKNVRFSTEQVTDDCCFEEKNEVVVDIVEVQTAVPKMEVETPITAPARESENFYEDEVIDSLPEDEVYSRNELFLRNDLFEAMSAGLEILDMRENIMNPFAELFNVQPKNNSAKPFIEEIFDVIDDDIFEGVEEDEGVVAVPNSPVDISPVIDDVAAVVASKEIEDDAVSHISNQDVKSILSDVMSPIMNEIGKLNNYSSSESSEEEERLELKPRRSTRKDAPVAAAVPTKRTSKRKNKK